MKNQLTLLHFDNPEDLLEGMVTLQQHRIVIYEIYSAEPIPGIEQKLGLKRVRFGETIFKFSCLGGIGLTSLGCYFLEPQKNWQTALLNILILLVTIVIADRLFSVKAPKLIALKSGDRRYLAVVDTQHIPVKEPIAHLFQYTAAVELSPAIKILYA